MEENPKTASNSYEARYNIVTVVAGVIKNEIEVDAV